MELHHIPEKIHGIVRSYIGGMIMKIRFTVDDYTTSCQRVEKGMGTGCTISPILFVMGMGMVTRAAEKKRMDSGIYQSPIKGFKDDLTVTTTTHMQARWVLSTLVEDSVSWARMKLKAKKSRCLVLRKGRVKMQLRRGDPISRRKPG